MGQIRIIAGSWRGRKLSVADAPGLRPTPDRVRETLFNWLGQYLHGRVCLDLFAGSGALGFEAASRGAAAVTLVERNARLVRQLERHKHMLGADNVEIITADALQFAHSWSHPGVDVLFLDPPYRQGWLERLAPFLDRLVQPNGTIYAEAETPLTALGAWQVVRRGRAGEVHFHLLQRAET